jgi:release factor glutamine methyltransferase
MGGNIQTIKDIRFYLFDELNEIYDEPEVKALTNLIIKTVLNLTKLHQLYFEEKKVSNSEKVRIIEICKELKRGKPLQYIFGETEFFGCKIRVTPATLIPRPETEELVQLVLNENKDFSGHIIDFGTGSGCIAIALALNLPHSKITGIDISPEALVVAGENAMLNNVSVNFLTGDILSFDPHTFPKAGIIISNPPYVRNSERILMNKNVTDFEPHLALFVPDSDPLLYYKGILLIAGKILEPSGRIYFEINEAFGNEMTELMLSFGYSEVKPVSDINGKVRMIKGIKNV